MTTSQRTPRPQRRETDPGAVATTAVARQQLERKALQALTAQRTKRELQVDQVNEKLAALVAAGVRTVTLYALRNGISAQLHSGTPHRTAVSEGAMLVAQVLHREGVAAGELLSLLDLWKTRIDATDLLVAAEQLLGPGFCRLPYRSGTPLADFCEVLFGSAHEYGDLIAAGGVVTSVQRKLDLIERGSQVRPESTWKLKPAARYRVPKEPDPAAAASKPARAANRTRKGL